MALEIQELHRDSPDTSVAPATAADQPDAGEKNYHSAITGVTPVAAQRQLITCCSLILNTRDNDVMNATDLPASDMYVCTDITVSVYASGVQRINFNYFNLCHKIRWQKICII